MIANFFRLIFISALCLSALGAQEPSAPSATPKPALPPPSPASAPTPASDPSVSARSIVLEVAGAFANDGYKVRDGYWSGKLEAGKPQLIEVNLFAGNEYWFSAAAMPPAEQIELKIFDELGKQVEGQKYEDGLKVAAGIETQFSGKYFVQIQMLKGSPAEFCLIYSYK